MKKIVALVLFANLALPLLGMEITKATWGMSPEQVMRLENLGEYWWSERDVGNDPTVIDLIYVTQVEGTKASATYFFSTRSGLFCVEYAFPSILPEAVDRVIEGMTKAYGTAVRVTGERMEWESNGTRVVLHAPFPLERSCALKRSVSVEVSSLTYDETQGKAQKLR